MEKLETVMAKVNDFQAVAKEIISNACYGALLARGFIVDETAVEPEKKRRDRGPKTSYIEQANKKKFCVRLTWYYIKNIIIILFLIIVQTYCAVLLHWPTT